MSLKKQEIRTRILSEACSDFFGLAMEHEKDGFAFLINGFVLSKAKHQVKYFALSEGALHVMVSSAALGASCTQTPVQLQLSFAHIHLPQKVHTHTRIFGQAKKLFHNIFSLQCLISYHN